MATTHSPASLSPATLSRWLVPGARVYWPGCAGHSPLFEQWLRDDPGLAAGVDFCGVWIPGVNRFDPTALHAHARATTFFLPPELHAGWQRGAVDLLPLHYAEIERYLATPGRFDVLMLHLAPPDEAGMCSLSLAADFAPAVMEGLAQGAAVLAHINPALPRTGGPAIAQGRIHAWVHADTPPLTMEDAAPSAALAQVARQVAVRVHDGDTLQFGLGRLQSAVLAALHSHRQLRLHTGMVSSGLLGLMQAGALAPLSRTQPPVCTGVAVGSPGLYAALADAALVRFAPVNQTHGAAALAAVPRLVAINSALEIDLLGQVNCETLAGRQVSGVGGLVDFVRGARASPGGRAIVAATATVGSARLSRIVPSLSGPVVGLARSDADEVITEFGVAALRHLGVDARARALIAIAAPEHRETLQAAWHTLRRNF